MNIETWLNAVLALFAVLNPVGNIPIYAEFTENLDAKGRFKLYNMTIVTGIVVLLVMVLTGRWIMSHVFQIDILEFRIAGGILLTVLATKYIVFPQQHHHAVNHAGEGGSALEFGIVPMAVPLLVGPGSIVTGILILDRDGYMVALTAIGAVFVLSWVLIQLSSWINRVMGRIGRLVVSRILWIFIAAIGVHFLLSGLREFFGM